jgi:hypothetical protein
MVRAIDEVEARIRDKEAGCPGTGPQILRSDFDNLFELRRKLVHLKNHLDEWLPKNAGFLHTDVVTTIDTTSGYIWMPLVAKKIKESEQSGIYACSVSILATPLDLRVYMDFGGRSLKERRRYFDYLDHSAEYEALRHDLEKQNSLEVFDIDWYSSLVCRRHFRDWIDRSEVAIEEARAKLAGVDEHSKDPITWNRLLHGYIFSKVDLGAKGYLDFPMIEPQLRDIIKLFESYHAYKSEAERKDRKDVRGENDPQ